MKKLLLVCLATLLSIAAFAQTGTVKGRIIDGTNGEGLVGANVVLKGTAVGAMTDINGNFTINNVEAGKKTFVVSFIGFIPQEVEATVKAGGVTDLGSIKVAGDAIGLNEIEVVAAIAQDRKTPVAVSNIKADVIETKLGSQEFPEILKVTPGVYATKQGGGYGDSRINLRGFNSQNVAVMINGVPVNDMESGQVYWSNWAGLADVTRAMQVQRGLGASRVAVPSIGGTINILTKTTDMEKGGSIGYAIGNNGYSKASMTLSTGLTENNWAVTISGARTEGEGYIPGTPFEGYSYFFNVSKMINDAHTISLTGFGAPQWHGQRYNRYTVNELKNQAPDGILHNGDWGYLNGEFVSVSDNFYHKPQFSLNHYWTISDKTELSNVVYASTGTGGGGRSRGNVLDERFGDPLFGPLNLDAVQTSNRASIDGSAQGILYASRNDHKWYGLLSTLDHELGSNLRLLGGLDVRYYRGSHFYEITNLLGADYFVDENNAPTVMLEKGDIFGKNYDGLVLWEGAFTQLEYTKERLSAFLSLAGSNTSYTRYEKQFTEGGTEESPTFNYLGYSAKGGANYNLTERHNIFANLGYFEKAPDFNAVFQYSYSNQSNPDAANQKILSYELGYGFRSSVFSANLNVYRTNWRDRTFSLFMGRDQEGNSVYANIAGVNALHQGVEFDFNLRPTQKLTISGMASLGDWTWQNNIDNVVVQAENGETKIINLFIAGLKVGDAAQTTAALVVDYQLIQDFTVGFTFNHYDDLYAQFDPEDRNAKSEGEADLAQSWKLPSYQLFDANVRYKFDLADFDATLFGNVNNLFDTEYISDGYDGNDHSGLTSTVYYGFGRTYNLGLKVKF